MKENNTNKKIYHILLLFAFVLIGTLCKLLSSVILPVIFTLLITFALYPLVKKITNKLHFPWLLSVITTILILIGILLAVSSLLVKGLSTIIAEYPKYESRFISLYEMFANQFNLSFDAEKSLFNNMWSILQVREIVQKMAIFLSSGVITAGKTAMLIILLLVFLLIEINSVKKRVISFVGNDSEFNLMDIIRQTVKEVSQYLSIKFFISLLTGILVYLGSLVIGLNFPIVWGFVAFLMNFIPTFGSIISTLITVVFAVLQFYPSFGRVIFIFVLMLAVNIILGNIVEPRIQGKQLGLSPFAILVSLSLFGYIWGFAGMILAVPITVIIKIVSENIPELHFFAIILGSNPENLKNKED